MKELKADFRRSLFTVRMLLITAGLTAALAASSWDLIRACLINGTNYSVIDLLGMSLMMDKFKVLMVILTGGIYTAGFCYDFRHHYLRLILTRTDSFSYCVSKFISNTASVIAACVLAFYLFTGITVCLGIPVSSDSYSVPCYYQAAFDAPVLYIGMMALQFGAV